jgi:nucleotidyltransferase/DNA polymerase involved in DNA repair
MAVGSTSMLSTSNYLARKFGVRAGMPGFIGKKLCPDLVLIPLNFDKYRAVSKVVRDVFREYDPDFCPMSLDEAYLDITDYLKEHPEVGKNKQLPLLHFPSDEIKFFLRFSPDRYIYAQSKGNAHILY